MLALFFLALGVLKPDVNGFDCRVLQALQGSLGRRFSSEHPTDPLHHVQGSGGDGPVAVGDWLGQEAKAPSSALPG